MYRSDATRSGYTPEQLTSKLSLCWKYKAPHAPAVAWQEFARMNFDYTYHPVILNGILYYGSSADCKVYALDGATGKEVWSFFTGGPVRFAPVVWKECVFVGSDDGYLYSLSANDGKLLWKHRAGPNESMVLGNGYMVSRWPIRGGPVIRDGIIYFAAGIWLSEGVYIYALDAVSGKIVWCKETSSIKLGQPHDDGAKISGVSAQGYLVATENQLFIPTGRACLTCPH